MEKLLVALVGCIFKHGSILESLKMGLLTPVFNNKGTRQQAINYRGITVLPVIGKIVETVIKCRTNNCVLETQNKRQRGFTAGSSPMNSVLPIEESYRNRKTTMQSCTWYFWMRKRHLTQSYIATCFEGYSWRALMMDIGIDERPARKRQKCNQMGRKYLTTISS